MGSFKKRDLAVELLTVVVSALNVTFQILCVLLCGTR